jgi:hypothetical protein
MPVILCSGSVENCHLNCGHDGDYAAQPRWQDQPFWGRRSSLT